MAPDRLAENHIRSRADIDRGRLRFDLTDGAQKAFTAYSPMKSALDGDDSDLIVFQCECGRLGLIAYQGLNYEPFKSYVEKRRFQCAECGDYELSYDVTMKASKVVVSGMNELHSLFERAVSDNYMTLCYYFWSSLMSFTPRFNEVYYLCDYIMDLHFRNVLIGHLDKDGIGQIGIDAENAERQERILMMLMINHVIEIAELYEILFTVAKIAKSEHFLVCDDGLSMQSVGYQIRAEEGEEDRVKQRITTVRRELHAMHLFKLSRLMKIAFNHELRNAFSHSEYRLTDDGVYLTRYKRTISRDGLAEAFLSAFVIQKALFDFMEIERQRFIASGGYEENGWRIEPVVSDRGFAIRVSGFGGGVTGRVRRERQVATPLDGG